MRPSSAHLGGEEPRLPDLRRLVGGGGSSWRARRRGPCPPRPSAARSRDRSSARPRPPRSSMPAGRCARPAAATNGSSDELGVVGEQRDVARRRRRSSARARVRLEQVVAGGVGQRHRASRCSSSSSPIRYERPPPMTSTASPSRTSPREPAGGRLHGARRGDGDAAGCARATASARPAAEAMVVSGSRPAQMSAMATASARREHVGERVEQRRGPVVGQRLVDGPDAAAGLALADRGERLPDRRRVVAVVVVHDDALRLALALEPPADARRTTRGRATIASAPAPRQRPRPRRRSAFDALWRPAVGRRAVTGPASGSRPRMSTVVASGSAAMIRPRSAVAGPGGRAEPVGDATRERPGALRLDVDERRRHDPARPVGEARDQLRDAGVSHVRDEHRRRPGPAGPSTPAMLPDPAPRTPRAPPPRSANTSGWSHSAEVRTDRPRAGTGRSCPRTRPPRRRTARRRPAARSPATPIPVTRRRQQRPDERARVHAARRQHVDEPAGRRALAVRPRHRDQRPPRRRVRHDLLPRPRAGCPPRGRRPAPALSGSIAVSALVTASRAGGRPRRPGRARGRGGPPRWTPAASSAGVYGAAPPGSQPSTAAPAHAASSAAAEAPAPCRADDVDPLPGSDRARGPGGREPRADRRRAADRRHGRIRAHAAPPLGRLDRARSSSRAALGAGALVRAAVAGPQVAAHLAGAPMPATATYTRPTGFSSVPPSGPATPVTPTPRSACEALARALGHRHGDLRGDRAVRVEGRLRHARAAPP